MGDRPDWSPKAVDVLVRAEWAAVEGTDKNLAGTVAVLVAGSSIVISYAVPAEKKLYITQWGVSFTGSTGIQGRLQSFTGVTTTTLAVGGGNFGFTQTFSKPIVIDGGVSFYLGVTVGGAGAIECSASGYEI